MIVPDEILMSKIYFIRGQKVILDSDLAELYQVETKALKQAVKRNEDIFPLHFMFELTVEEFEVLRSQNVTSSSIARWLMAHEFENLRSQFATSNPKK